MMKFIEVGTQPGKYTQRTYDPATDSYTLDLIPISERYLRVYAPWKQTLYCVNRDSPVSQQHCFHLYWYRHPNKALAAGFLRWGWQ